MKFRLFGFLVSFAALLAAPAYAAETAASCPLNEDGTPSCATPKLELGARVGVGLPLGSAVSGTPMNDSVAAQLPVQLDFGFRPDPHVFVGVYGAYGFLFPATGVCDGASCSAAT